MMFSFLSNQSDLSLDPTCPSWLQKSFLMTYVLGIGACKHSVFGTEVECDTCWLTGDKVPQE